MTTSARIALERYDCAVAGSATPPSPPFPDVFTPAWAVRWRVIADSLAPNLREALAEIEALKQHNVTVAEGTQGIEMGGVMDDKALTDTELLNALELHIKENPLVLWNGEGTFPGERAAGLSLCRGRRTLRQAIQDSLDFCRGGEHGNGR